MPASNYSSHYRYPHPTVTKSDPQSADTTAKPRRHLFRKISKSTALTLMAIILLPLGIIMGIYSPWLQDALVQRLVEKMNAGSDTHISVGTLRLRFPLDLEVNDVLMVSHGDTLVQVGDLTASVSVWPLLEGKVDLKGADLTKARYQMGALDSASCMTIRAEKLKIDRSTVVLSPMDIHVSKVYLAKGGMDMFINPADTFPTAPATEATPLNIRVDRIDYDSLTFAMQLMPTIFNLRTDIASGAIDSVSVDVLKQTVDVRSFTGQRMNAAYLMPDSAQIAATTVIVNPDKPASAPWTVTVGNIDMTDSKALYTTFGLSPEPGLDFNYIQVDSVDLRVSDFYNQAATVKLPFSLAGTERCGLRLNASGTLAIDSVGMTFDNFALDTPESTSLRVDGYMGTATELTNPETPLRLNLSGDLSIADAETMFPAFKPYFVGMRPGAIIDADIILKGTSGRLQLERVKLDADRHIKLNAHGLIEDMFSDSGMAGDIYFDGIVTDVSHWTADLLAGTGVRIPTMTLDGHITFDRDNYRGDLIGKTGGGTLALNGAFYGNQEKYNLNLNARALPVSAFMPTMGIGRLTGTVVAEGHGFDFFKASTAAKVNLDIKEVEYLKTAYHNITLDADLTDSHASAVLDSYSPGLDAHLTAEGHAEGNHYIWSAKFDSKSLDLKALGLSDTEATVAADFDVKADMTANLRDVDATLDLRNLEYNTAESNIFVDDSRIMLSASDSVTNLTARNRDMFAYYSSPLPLDSVMGRVDRVSALLSSEFENRKINIPAIQQAVMPFRLDIEAGSDNVLTQILSKSDISFKSANILASNDSLLYLKADVDGFRSGQVLLDTITFNIRQDGERLNYYASVNNRPGTFDQWAHVDVDGYFTTGKLGINLKQQNIKNRVGFDLGATLTFNPDSTMVLHFEPYDPIVNYRKWSVNESNFITYDYHHKHLDADLRMKSDVSRIALYTENANDTVKAHHGADEDLVLQLFDIQLQDWIALNPFAPPMKGNLSAGVRVNWHDNYLSGDGTIAMSDFIYGKEKVGDFRADINLFTDVKGLIKADAEMWVNGEKTMVLSGALNDSTRTSPFNLDFKMIHFPLSVANPFLTGTAKLNGSLNGSMDISGDSSNPILNGYLAFEGANVDVTMLGSTLTLTEDTIPVRDNLVTLDNFTVKGVNENPLFINGTVDISNVASPKINLDLNADNMQIVNTNRARKGADIYGKAYIGLKSQVKGDLNFLNVTADVDLLPGTNVTYVMADGAAAIENQAAGSMVKFVNFADTAAVAAADSLKLEGMLLNLNAGVNIHTGTTINVDLGANVQDRVILQGSGKLTYASSPVGDGRLTGRYTLNGGGFKYAPPLISNLNFNFTEGSYVAFSGNMLNPQLNIRAVERMRANVSQAGQNSRLIYFDIILSVTGTLETMNVAFDLETDDDVTVANELASMSPTQRASEAMNLLLYNTYTGGSTKATSNLNGNPLFSFLTNQVNSWLANNVRGVDLSIGVDQYDQTTNGATSTTTSYSYRVSKSLFDDRFKIVVGGSYSNDANADENVAENLINDISFEYYLNNARTMYVRLFRHTGYVSILEGEITQTGVGFVYRKKINRVSDMFIPRRFRKYQPWEEGAPAPARQDKNKNSDDSKEPEAQAVQTKEATLNDENAK